MDSVCLKRHLDDARYTNEWLMQLQWHGGAVLVVETAFNCRLPRGLMFFCLLFALLM